MHISLKVSSKSKRYSIKQITYTKIGSFFKYALLLTVDTMLYNTCQVYYLTTGNLSPWSPSPTSPLPCPLPLGNNNLLILPMS